MNKPKTTPPIAPILTAQNLSLCSANGALLSDISLSIIAGEALVIMGHNGAGKTLCLELLHGLISAQSGTLHSPPAISQKMVFQKPILLRRSAQAHFAFATNNPDPAFCASWFEKAGLTGKQTTHARALSSGEAQKLALISALASQPDILFLDEPTSNLDAESRHEVESLLAKAKQEGITLIIVTHNRSQAELLGDKMIFIHKGTITDNAPAADILCGACSTHAQAFFQTR